MKSTTDGHRGSIFRDGSDSRIGLVGFRLGAVGTWTFGSRDVLGMKRTLADATAKTASLVGDAAYLVASAVEGLAFDEDYVGCCDGLLRFWRF